MCARRCDENRMEVSSLALVMAPNLLPCSPQMCRLTALTEKLLEQRAAAIRTLILHAERIGETSGSGLNLKFTSRVNISTGV